MADQCRITSLDSQSIDLGAPMARGLREKIAVGRFDRVSDWRTGPPPPGWRGEPMVNWLLRLFGIIRGEGGLDKFEPIYGLPTRSLDEWLSRNPALRKHQNWFHNPVGARKDPRLSGPLASSRWF